MFRVMMLGFHRRLANAPFTMSQQKVSIEPTQLEIRAFLSWTVLWRLTTMNKQEIYKHYKNSYRRQLIEEVKQLNYVQGSNQKPPSTLKQVEQFLEAYQVGGGIPIDETYERNKLQKKYSVLNPTTVTQAFLEKIIQGRQIHIGNKGIGKTFSLFNFQYLSFWRFKYLHARMSIENITKLIGINAAYFSHEPASSQIIDTLKPLVLQVFKSLPLFVYFQSTPGLSWQQFYQKLTQQFPYITLSESASPKKQQETEDQYIQRKFKEMSQKLCSKLNRFFSDVKKQDFYTVIVIDQANNYLRQLNKYYYLCTKQRTDKEKDKIKKQYQTISLMSDQIELLKSVSSSQKVFFFSEQAQLDILKQTTTAKYLGGFTEIVMNPRQRISIFENKYAYSQSNIYDQNEIFSFLELAFKQSLIGTPMLDKLQKQNVLKFEKFYPKYLAAVKQLDINTVLQEIIKHKSFKFNITFLKISQQLRGQIEQSSDTFNQNADTSNQNADTSNQNAATSKQKETLKKIFNLLQSYVESPKKEYLEQVQTLSSEFLNTLIDTLNNLSPIQHKNRILKKYNSVQNTQEQKNKIYQFYNQLCIILQKLVNEDMERQINTLQQLEKKQQKQPTIFIQKKQRGETDVFKGDFAAGCNIQGQISGEQLEGLFSGYVVSGNIQENRSEQKTDQNAPNTSNESVPKADNTQNTTISNTENTQEVNSQNLINSGDRKEVNSQNLIVTNKYGVLKNGVFIGKFEGKVKKGILFGTMTGELKGYKITAQRMQKYWQTNITRLSLQNTLKLFKKWLSRLQYLQISKNQCIQQQQMAFLYKLTHKSILTVQKQGIVLNIPRDQLLRLVGDTFTSAAFSQQILRLQAYLDIPAIYYQHFDQLITLGLSQNKGVLTLKGQQNLEIKLVNKRAQVFTQFTATKDIYILSERFRVDLDKNIEELEVGEGIGYRPVTLTMQYSKNSLSIDTLFIFKNSSDQLYLITFDYTFVATFQEIKEKLQKNKKFFDTHLKNDKYFKTTFFGNYLHYILVSDKLYIQSEQKRRTLKLQSYQRIVRASGLNFESNLKTYGHMYPTKSAQLMKRAIKLLQQHNLSQ